MSKEFKVGDKVRIRPNEIEGFLAEYKSKRRDRLAVIEAIHIAEENYDSRVRMRWLKRNNRGKEFTEGVRMSHFLRYWEAVCA